MVMYLNYCRCSAKFALSKTAPAAATRKHICRYYPSGAAISKIMEQTKWMCCYIISSVVTDRASAGAGWSWYVHAHYHYSAICDWKVRLFKRSLLCLMINSTQVGTRISVAEELATKVAFCRFLSVLVLYAGTRVHMVKKHPVGLLIR